MPKTQQTFDFPRGEKLSLLRDAILPPSVKTKRGGVSGVTLKAILRAIDDHGPQCYAKEETLAAEVNCSTETFKRGIKALQQMDLLIVQRRKTPRGPVCNHYTIVWNSLRLLGEQPTQTKGSPEFDQSVMVTPDQSVMVRDQSVMVRDQSVMGDTSKKRIEATQEATSPSSPSKRQTDEGWAEAEGAVVRCGLLNWKDPLAEARQRVTPEYVLQLVAHFHSSGGAYGKGALVKRLQRSHPDIPPNEGWPKKSTATANGRPNDPETVQRETLEHLLFVCRSEARRNRLPVERADQEYLKLAAEHGIPEEAALELIA